MKKICKKILTMALFFAMLIGTLIGFKPLKAEAATSVSAAQQSKMKNLCDVFQDFAGFSAYNAYKTSYTKTYDFSKASVRKKMISYSDRCFKTAKQLGGSSDVLKKNISRDLFGKSTANPGLKVSGDWGDFYPRIEYTNITGTNKNTYQVNGTLFFHLGHQGSKKTEYAKLVFTLKKYSKSSYGYVVTKLTLYNNSKIHTVYTKKMKSILKSNSNIFNGIEYYYKDLDSDGIDEVFMLYHDPSQGSSDQLKVYTYNKGKAKLICSHQVYGLREIKCYKKTKSFTVWSAGHGGEIYRYFKYSKGKYQLTATKSRVSTVGGSATNGAWYYYKGSKSVSTDYTTFMSLRKAVKSGSASKISYTSGKWKMCKK